MTPTRLTASIGQCIARTDLDISAATLHNATISILDTIACAVAGSCEPASEKAESALLLPETHASPLLWLNGAAAPDAQALVLGAATHALDYDDVFMGIIAHPSAPVLASLLPLTRRQPVSGLALLEAFIVGTETMIRVGQCLGFHHFSLGFHATATLGAIGAAAGCARLLALPADQASTALAISASMASGVRANFGSMTKPLHAGLAASSGVRAALLARAGYSAAQEALEGPAGFFSAFSGARTLEAPGDLQFGRPFAVGSPGFSLKRFPCCYMTHKLIKGALQLRARGVSLDQLTGMDVVMPVGGTKPLIHPFPANGLNAKFSGPYTIAAALQDGRIDSHSFTDGMVIRPEIQSRLRLIQLREEGPALHDAQDVGDAPVRLSATCVQGKQHDIIVESAPGSPEDPLGMPEIREKWLDCFALRRQNANAIATKHISHASVAAGTLQHGQASASRTFETGMALADIANAASWLEALAQACTDGEPR